MAQKRTYRRYKKGYRTNGKKSRFEDEVARWLDEKGIGYEYEKKKFRYFTTHQYTPDFILENGVILEVKGYFAADDRAKLLALKKFYPNLDVRLVFKKNNKIHKKSTMRYSDWAQKHGFKYAINEIPDEWLKEKPRKVPKSITLGTLKKLMKELKLSTEEDE